MIKTEDIKEHMEVIGSDGEHVGTVDHLEGTDKIKLTKSDEKSGGKHHLDSGRLDRPRGRARPPQQAGQGCDEAVAGRGLITDALNPAVAGSPLLASGLSGESALHRLEQQRRLIGLLDHRRLGEIHRMQDRTAHPGEENERHALAGQHTSQIEAADIGGLAELNVKHRNVEREFLV